MSKRSFHIIIALLLVFTTTGTLWKQLLTDKEDLIEISSEKDAKKGEKETEKELDDWDDDLIPETFEFIAEIQYDYLKADLSGYSLHKESPKKLYLLYQSLRLHC